MVRRALDAVSLEILPGEVHAIIGENGAGKSTLINILSGIVAPDGGELLLEGRPVALATPQHAQRAGIALCIRSSASSTISRSLKMYSPPAFPSASASSSGSAWHARRNRSSTRSAWRSTSWREPVHCPSAHGSPLK